MKSLRQLQLTASADGQLELSGKSQLATATTSIDTISRQYVLSLPDEVLSQIINLAVDTEEHVWLHRCMSCRSFARTVVLVCKRFYQLGIHLLYQCVQSAFRTTFVPASTRVFQLHRTLEANPSLRTYCRILKVDVPDLVGQKGTLRNNLDWDATRDIVSWLTDVQEFTLHGGFERYPETIWSFLATVAESMPRLSTLKLSRECFNLDPEALLTVLPKFTCLKSLSVHGFSRRQWDRHLLHTLAVPVPHSGTITHLEISQFSDTPEAFRTLLQWPKALHHFSFSDCDSGSGNLSPSDFRSLLLDHKQSLTSLELTSLFSRNRNCLDVSDFPALIKLTIPAFDTHATSSEAAAKLLAPNLYEFTWSFSLQSQTGPQISDFSRERADWLSEFLHLAGRKESALKKVYVDFGPEFDMWYGAEDVDEDVEVYYPWDHMEKIAADVARFGIELTWAKPRMTREDLKQRHIFEGDEMGTDDVDEQLDSASAAETASNSRGELLPGQRLLDEYNFQHNMLRTDSTASSSAIV